MENGTSVIELLEFLRDTIDRAAKVPMSGKVMIDKKEIQETIDEIINYLPKELENAKWVVDQKDKIIGEARRELAGAQERTEEIKRANIENHDLVRDAKLRAGEIIGASQREAKAIRIGSRDYSDEVLTDLNKELERKRVELIKNLQLSFEKTAKEIDDNLSGACSTIKENIKELRNFK